MPVRTRTEGRFIGQLYPIPVSQIEIEQMRRNLGIEKPGREFCARPGCGHIREAHDPECMAGPSHCPSFVPQPHRHGDGCGCEMEHAGFAKGMSAKDIMAHETTLAVRRAKAEIQRYASLAENYAEMNAGVRPDGKYVGIVVEAEDGSEQDVPWNFPTAAQAQVYATYLLRSFGPGYAFRLYDSDDPEGSI